MRKKTSYLNGSRTARVMEIQDAPRWLDMWGVLSMARLMNPTMYPSNACSGCEPANARRPGFKRDFLCGTNNGDLGPGGYKIDKTEAKLGIGFRWPDRVLGHGRCRQPAANAQMVPFVRDVINGSKPVGVILPRSLAFAEANVLNGRTVTSYASIRTNIENAVAHGLTRR